MTTLAYKDAAAVAWVRPSAPGTRSRCRAGDSIASRSRRCLQVLTVTAAGGGRDASEDGAATRRTVLVGLGIAGLGAGMQRGTIFQDELAVLAER